MHSFRICIDTTEDRNRVLGAVVRAAMRTEIALIRPPRPGMLFRIAATSRRYFKRVFLTEPARIVGIYRITVDNVGYMIDALLEDMRDAAHERA